MTRKNFYAAGLVLMTGIVACNNSTPVDSNAATATTTTTTTTITRHRYAGSFSPKPDTKYIDLKTNKEVKISIDTTQGMLVNDETNEPIDLFVEPMTHDTIYALTGTIVNNALIHDESGAVRVDTVKIKTIAIPENPAPEPAGKFKEKQSDTKIKYKDEDVKIKEKNGVIKTRER